MKRHNQFSLLLLATLLALAECVSAYASAGSRATGAASDIEVLQAVLVAVAPLGSKYLVLADQPHPFRIEQERLEGQLATLGKRFKLSVAPLLADYETRNTKGRFPTNLEAPNVRFAGADDLKKMFDGDALGGWKRFWARYEGADALAEISLPGFSPDRTTAIVTYFLSRGSMAGDARVVLLHRAGASWEVVWSEILFAT